MKYRMQSCWFLPCWAHSILGTGLLINVLSRRNLAHYETLPCLSFPICKWRYEQYTVHGNIVEFKWVNMIKNL